MATAPATATTTTTAASPVRLPLRLILAGPPGSGKGSVGDLLHAEFRVVLLSTGQMLRDEVATGSPLGRQVKEAMARGDYIHEDQWLPLLKRALESDDCKRFGWIVDGAPRMRRHVDRFHQEGIVPDLLIFLECPDEVVIERLQHRRLDPITGAIYNLKTHPPPADILERLVQRSDDQVEAIRHRLELYHESFRDVASWYPAGKFVRIDASADLDSVYAAVRAALPTTKAAL